MKRENLQLLLKLVANYVSNCESIEEIKSLLNTLENQSKFDFTEGHKNRLRWATVHALNGSAYEEAFFIRLQALVSEDDGLIEDIEHLHKVI